MSSLAYITRGVELSQSRLIQRAIRQNTFIRHSVSKVDLINILSSHVPATCETLNIMQDYVGKLPDNTENVQQSAMEIASENEGADAAKEVKVVKDILPEVEVYLFTLILTTMLRYEHLNQASASASEQLIQRIRQFNRRTLDLLNAKAYFYFSLAFERINKLNQIRSSLMTLYQTSCYHQDAMSRSVLLNCLIRNYYNYNLIQQVQLLTDKTSLYSSDTGISDTVSHNQYCRYVYYLGRMHAIQLDYSKAYGLLLMAIRKAPQDYAFGFTKAVTKLMVLVQLLMGGIPERSIFNGNNNITVRNALKPYLYLTQAVREGNIEIFNTIANHAVYKDIFIRDKNYLLVKRLEHNVLKTGLKKISISYSRISFRDIAAKLHLHSVSGTELVPKWR